METKHCKEECIPTAGKTDHANPWGAEQWRRWSGVQKTSSSANSATNPQQAVNASKPCLGPFSNHHRLHIINHCPTFINGFHGARDKCRSRPEQVQRALGSCPCMESHTASLASLHSPACYHSPSPVWGNCRTLWESCSAQAVIFQSFLRREMTH